MTCRQKGFIGLTWLLLLTFGGAGTFNPADNTPTRQTCETQPVACTINIVTTVNWQLFDHKCNGLFYKHDYNRNWWLYKNITIVNDASGGMLQIVGTLFIVIYNCKWFIVQATVASLTYTTENINKLDHFQNTTF